MRKYIVRTILKENVRERSDFSHEHEFPIWHSCNTLVM
ncbi:MAG: hypothetical protein Sylvanvirus15_16 [Sylvanvirus sp.]|uniref:Uncharacterized protein n=1 Tax=Sylvanvirus sp. TaxID=2487774 RepID=A0A3G5AJL8_9VIRU|nr:MAG: hypothetical protein Sylvanvirus15_16 [Sylvanvirus sp.]